MNFTPGATHEALPLDPENDIDAKSAARWVIGGAIVLFISLWLMVPIFTQVQDYEQRRKVNEAPNTELDAVREAEGEFLAGQNPTRKNLEDVLRTLRGN